ncbi:uncharacterized protein PAC_15014 [Phialocephala subalpina]|uniref:Uncharacterized protein n=1 Tax=Phialocephala subalpina TaxID=576137 RepID=A0A1L7XJC9_9HELO|nr:uncharacterized protein PAC_15014 [Phialocephala subalpina]
MDENTALPSGLIPSDGEAGAAGDSSQNSGNDVKPTADPDICISSPDSTPPPPTLADIDRWNYHTSMKAFGEALQAAANAVFPNEREASRYSQVSVLLISWSDEDPKLPVSLEIEKLHRVFQDVYGYDTEHWKIPDQNCHHKLTKKIVDFVEPTDESTKQLKIVYYAGHARLLDTRVLAWTSWRNNKKSKCPIVKWAGIQTILEESSSDVLILLDCCASGTANTSEGYGVSELISACAYNQIANGVGPYSFTSALVIELRRLSRKASFSVGELYRNIFFRIQSRMPEDLSESGCELERYPAPIHLVLTQDSAVLRTTSQQPEIPSQSEGNGASQPLDETRSPISNITPWDNLMSQGNSSPVPRLAFAIRLRETFQPSDDMRDHITEWLSNMPIDADQVKVEAGFDAFSTLVVLSVPLAISAYLSFDPAVISLGPIRSENRIASRASTTDNSSRETVEELATRTNSNETLDEGFKDDLNFFQAWFQMLVSNEQQACLSAIFQQLPQAANSHYLAILRAMAKEPTTNVKVKARLIQTEPEKTLDVTTLELRRQKQERNPKGQLSNRAREGDSDRVRLRPQHTGALAEEFFDRMSMADRTKKKKFN